ncbi:MAG: ABC transporter ATP-binding protein [Propioniciclava sp.]
MTNVIDLTGLEKTFHPRGEEPVRAVRGIDLSVGGGEVVALLGPNGAGKTTTLDMVLGLSSPSAGTATLFGLDPRQAIAAGRVSAVLQSGGLLGDLRVREIVAVVASMFPRHQGVATVLEKAGLSQLADRKIAKCSGGEQQRIRFALALLPDPDLLILDEPTAGMDVTARADFWATMRAEADEGRTIVFATHYLAEAEDFAARTVLIDRGAVVADGPTASLRERSGQQEIRITVADVAAARRAVADLGGTVVAVAGSRLTIHATASDQLALVLLRDLGGSQLEVVLPTLENAFAQLTGTES